MFGGQVEFRCLKVTGNPNTGKFKPSSGNICTGTHQLTKWADLHFWSLLETVFQAQLQWMGCGILSSPNCARKKKASKLRQEGRGEIQVTRGGQKDRHDLHLEHVQRGILSGLQTRNGGVGTGEVSWVPPANERLLNDMNSLNIYYSVLVGCKLLKGTLC